MSDGNVIDIRSKVRAKSAGEAARIEGPAVCLRCAARWHAVVPVGYVRTLECPNCHCNTGTLTQLCTVPATEMVLTCKCGCQQFALSSKAAYCVNCGVSEPVRPVKDPPRPPRIGPALELKPCPFCKSNTLQDFVSFRLGEGHTAMVRCLDCGGEATRDTWEYLNES